MFVLFWLTILIDVFGIILSMKKKHDFGLSGVKSNLLVNDIFNFIEYSLGGYIYSSDFPTCPV